MAEHGTVKATVSGDTMTIWETMQFKNLTPSEAKEILEAFDFGEGALIAPNLWRIKINFKVHKEVLAIQVIYQTAKSSFQDGTREAPQTEATQTDAEVCKADAENVILAPLYAVLEAINNQGKPKGIEAESQAQRQQGGGAGGGGQARGQQYLPPQQRGGRP